jgi:hypothetical protein
MNEKKMEGHVLPIQILRSDTSWEHQERSVYTVQALSTEFANLLAPPGNGNAPNPGTPSK